ncbi:hypothetical protein [Rhodopirellula baltica]|uniref:Uncharacterized protein n=1 Tax=Rhodopirellula baltica SWK14 TaxID=993516 RepID=L7CRF2_RHOBT|nr:hypothetical protein [Rhodopirellula baltica]ELP35661.1 hypothetical protein RBSWK_00371 [Rhodopirellula baltica SWK14]
MAGLFLPPQRIDGLGRWAWRTMLLLALVCLQWSAFAESPRTVEAQRWKTETLASIALKIQNASSDDERLEYSARQSWLRRWRPGHMPSAPADAPNESELMEEPVLADMQRPESVDGDVWSAMVDLQKRLIASDTDEERKDNLRKTIELAGKLEQSLMDHLPAESQTLATPTGWTLAFTRYRLGRALAYRELPEVLERWPIAKPDEYESRLVAAFQRLTDQTQGDRRDFILLQDRMFRRSGKKGRALELLEANRHSIDPKWYLKKRRDLLQELGWEPPYREAARLYLQAGYVDE